MLKSKLSLSRHFEYANKQITYHFWLCRVSDCCLMSNKYYCIIIPPLHRKVEGILFYLCLSVRPSVRLSVCLSVRPSLCLKTFFVAFFSATTDGRNLIFGHKFHIGMPYCRKRFWTRQIPTSCLST